jgi:signal transduction histidine kinase
VVRRADERVRLSSTDRLVEDLLLLAQSERTDFLRREPIDLRPFVVELWDGVSLTGARRFEIGMVPDGTLVADPDRLAQALRNLARNAIEHTRPTAVTCSSARRPPEARGWSSSCRCFGRAR